MIRSKPSSQERTKQLGVTDIQKGARVAPSSQKGAEWLGKCWTILGMPSRKKDLSGKDLTEQSGES